MKSVDYGRAALLRVPARATMEDLDARGFDVFRYGDYVILSGHFYNGLYGPPYFAALFEFLEDGRTCEDFVELVALSDVEFYDPGHAFEWAIAGAVGK